MFPGLIWAVSLGQNSLGYADDVSRGCSAVSEGLGTYIIQSPSIMVLPMSEQTLLQR